MAAVAAPAAGRSAEGPAARAAAARALPPPRPGPAAKAEPARPSLPAAAAVEPAPRPRGAAPAPRPAAGLALAGMTFRAPRVAWGVPPATSASKEGSSELIRSMTSVSPPARAQTCVRLCSGRGVAVVRGPCQRSYHLCEVARLLRQPQQLLPALHRMNRWLRPRCRRPWTAARWPPRAARPAPPAAALEPAPFTDNSVRQRSLYVVWAGVLDGPRTDLLGGALVWGLSNDQSGASAPIGACHQLVRSLSARAQRPRSTSGGAWVPRAVQGPYQCNQQGLCTIPRVHLWLTSSRCDPASYCSILPRTIWGSCFLCLSCFSMGPLHRSRLLHRQPMRVTAGTAATRHAHRHTDTQQHVTGNQAPC